MALTYSDFKDFVFDFVWRQNDTDLVNSMDNIIRMANSELNRKLDIIAREKSFIFYPADENPVGPNDLYQIISLTNFQLDRIRGKRDGFMQQTTLQHIYNLRERNTDGRIEPYYYIRRKGDNTSLIFLAGGFSVANPGEMLLLYRTSIPDYAGTDESWMEDQYLDLYLYTILKHVGIYLREDDRVASYNALMADALASVLDEDKRKVQFGGSPLHMRPARTPPQTRWK